MPELSPRIENGEFVYPVRIYYEDTDAAGIVYYVNYLKFAERARSEMMRYLGIESSFLQDCHGIAFVVRKVEVEYLQPARLDDLLDVRLQMIKIGGASLHGLQTIQRGDEVLVRINIRLGCMKLDGGVGRLPLDVRNLLKTFMNEEQG